MKQCNKYSLRDINCNNVRKTWRQSTYVTTAKFGNMQRQQLHRDDGQNSLQTVDLMRNFNRLVRKLFNLIIIAVADDYRIALPTHTVPVWQTDDNMQTIKIAIYMQGLNMQKIIPKKLKTKEFWTNYANTPKSKTTSWRCLQCMSLEACKTVLWQTTKIVSYQ